MGNYDFDIDLIISEKTEHDIGRLIMSRNSNIKDVYLNNDGKYDLEVELNCGAVKFIEIKEDFKCAQTGNIAIEHKCRGKLSGISITEADIWIYKVHRNGSHELLAVSVDDLKKSISNSEYFRRVSGGDPGSDTLMYLYKYEKFKSLCKKL